MTGHSALIERLENECCNCGYAGLMHEAYEALRDLTEWRDIATAPKDGTEFVAYRPDQGVFVCRFAWLGEFVDDNAPVPYDDGFACWFHDRWGWLENDLTPTHWLPLPSAPNQAKEAGE